MPRAWGPVIEFVRKRQWSEFIAMPTLWRWRLRGPGGHVYAESRWFKSKAGMRSSLRYVAEWVLPKAVKRPAIERDEEETTS